MKAIAHISPKHALFWAFLMLTGATSSVFGQQSGGFSGGVTPSRFEISADRGERIARSISIYNLGDRPENFRIQTNDWSYSAEGQLSFQDPLTDNSCRPWVRLERHKISVVPSPNRPRKFRFEINVPDDAPIAECRFAIMVESLGEDYNTAVQGGIVLPTTGRIAVIVYLAVGEVSQKISIGEAVVVQRHKRLMPALPVTNSGTAHGRLDGTLLGVDATGIEAEYSIATSPILPGQTRVMLLSPVEEYSGGESISYPLKLKGRVYADNETFKLDVVVQASE